MFNYYKSVINYYKSYLIITIASIKKLYSISWDQCEKIILKYPSTHNLNIYKH